MAEYTAMLITSAVAVTLFLGGWYFPGLDWIRTNIGQTTYVIVSVAAFAAKIALLIYAYMWFRWTWPRYRYDQLMELGWKWMIPSALINIVLTGVWYVLALPASQGGVFGFLRDVNQRGRLVPAGFSAKAYFIGTAFLISIPITWAVLSAINRRSRDFNLHEQRQLQIKLRRERLEKRADAQPAEQA